MKIHLISGACGFVGKNMVKRLYRNTQDKLFIVDDLSIGTHPSTWMEYSGSKMIQDLEVIGDDERIYFWKGDFRDLLMGIRSEVSFKVLETTTYASNLLLEFVAFARVDFVLTRPASFVTMSDITL